MGIVSRNTWELLSRLDRPLHERPALVLYGTNLEVDIHNAERYVTYMCDTHIKSPILHYFFLRSTCTICKTYSSHKYEYDSENNKS